MTLTSRSYAINGRTKNNLNVCKLMSLVELCPRERGAGQLLYPRHNDMHRIRHGTIESKTTIIMFRKRNASKRDRPRQRDGLAFLARTMFT